MGLRLSIDDFGTGFSSFSYLQRFPIHSVKFPGDFVKGVITNPKDASIAREIIAMAHSLKARVIAEGVETEAQMSFF